MAGKTLMQAWADFVIEVGHKPEDIVAGVQRIHSDMSWTIPGSMLLDPAGMKLEDTGYTRNKITQLERHYINQASINRARDDLAWRIKNKKYGSGVWDFRGMPKKNTKQDYCMTAGVIAYYPQLKSTRVTIYYRTVELIKRFRGDLVFLREVVLPHFAESTQAAPIKEVAFKFANSTFHPMFTILLVQHLDDWKEHFNRIRESNPSLFRSMMYWGWRYIVDPSKSIDSYSSARQVRVIAERVTDSSRLRKFKLYVKRSIKQDLESYPASVQRGRIREEDMEE